MQKLNLPTYKFKIKSKENNYLIFDIIRKKYVFLTPEEWVRQHIIHYLIENKNYPSSLIAIEKKLLINHLTKRTDILVFNTLGKPDIIVECKAPNIKINQNTFDQIARYNLKLNANYLMVTNGLEHYFCKMDFKNECYIFIKELPNFN
ncbi:MAG: type I restriction enzyme HsdR N-terminal domain-containing protein [Lutibacter sp.]